MPLYTFRCDSEECKHEFDEKVPLADFDKSAVIPCPKCGKDAKRQLTALKSPSQSWKHWRS